MQGLVGWRGREGFMAFAMWGLSGECCQALETGTTPLAAD